MEIRPELEKQNRGIGSRAHKHRIAENHLSSVASNDVKAGAGNRPEEDEKEDSLNIAMRTDRIRDKRTRPADDNDGEIVPPQ
jgi:hypothetical protein